MTESALEPTFVGPVAGGHVRASDSDRDQVSAVLSTAFAEGRLTRDEYDERTDSLLRAKTFDDLVGLTRDLVVVAGPAPVQAAQASYAVDTSAGSEAPDRMVAVFSGTERKGRWRVRRHTEVYALFGGVELDLTEATFEAPEVEIRGVWAFAGVEIRVPAGVQVRDETMSIFGGADVKDVGDPVPGAPVLVVRGLNVFGGIAVRGPKKARLRGALGRRPHGSHGCGRH